MVVSFADMCEVVRGEGGPSSLSADYGQAMEGIVRALRSRPDPPSVVLFNHFSHHEWGCRARWGAFATRRRRTSRHLG